MVASKDGTAMRKPMGALFTLFAVAATLAACNGNSYGGANQTPPPGTGQKDRKSVV